MNLSFFHSLSLVSGLVEFINMPLCNFCTDLPHTTPHYLSRTAIARHCLLWCNRHDIDATRPSIDVDIDDIDAIVESEHGQSDEAPYLNDDEIQQSTYFRDLISIRTNVFIIVNSLSEADGLFLQLCEWMDNGQISRACYKQLRTILEEEKDIELPNLDRKNERLAQLTGLRPREIHCCLHSCIAYTGQYEALNTCPKCRHARLRSSGKPYCTFIYISLIERLRFQYKARLRAKTLQTYVSEFFSKPKEYIHPVIKD